MPRHKVLSEEDEFSVYFAAVKAPVTRSTREIAAEVLKGKVTAPVVSYTVQAMRDHEIAKDEVWARFESWAAGKRERRNIYEKSAEGKFTSSYPTVQAFINRAQASGLKTMHETLKSTDKIFHFLEYKDPANWDGDDLNRWLATRPASMKSADLIHARKVAPQLANYGSEEGMNAPRPGNLKIVNYKRYDLLTSEIVKALDHLDETGFYEASTIVRLHLVLGCREGSVVHEGEEPGLLNLPWSRVNLSKKTADVYEGKVKKGILWRDCPLGLFGWNVPDRIRELKGRVTEFEIGDRTNKIDSTSKVVGMSYESLLAVYHLFAQTLRAVNPDASFDDVTPHTGRHLHVNLLWERGVPMELIAGDSEAGFGLCGVGWTDLSTLKKFYFTLSMRSPKVEAARRAAEQASPALAQRIMAEAGKAE